MKKIFTLLAIAMLALPTMAWADEGMWIPMLLGRNEAAMQAAVEQKDNSELLKKAEQDTNAAVDARLDRLGIVKALNSTTFRRITEFASP